ncbi:MAG: tetratricopeptide repeat protein [Bacilli bacterium]|nr:tetratricopeptide repeat protein [Bacilli bacterium]HHU23774.1 tetratricopeptide repeat protein [Acholeplasmataceae bacterium]
MERLLTIIQDYIDGKDIADVATEIPGELAKAILKYGSPNVEEVLLEYFNKVPRAKLPNLFQLLRGSAESRKQAFIEAIESIQKKEFSEAEKTLIFLKDSFLLSNLKTPNVSYISPQGPFETLLMTSNRFIISQKPMILREPVSAYAFNLGVIQMAQGKFEEAKKYFHESVRFNPYASIVYLMLGEIAIMENDLQRVKSLVEKAMHMAYQKRDLGHSYYLLGKYYLAQKQKEPAVACLVVARYYDAKLNVNEVFAKIESQLEGTIKIPNSEGLQAIFKKYNLQLGPSRDIIALIQESSQVATEKGSKKAALQILQIGYELTDSPYYLEKINALKDA